MILTPSQVATFAHRAGFTGPGLVIATAIAHAESGFNDEAIGDVALENAIWGPSVGLWQIRTLKKDPPHIRDRNWLTGSPFNQAVAAYAISSNGTDFTPWSTFNTGAYLQYMDEAVKVVNSLNGGTMPTLSFHPLADGSGYFIFSSDGAVYAFGSAKYAGGLQWNGASWVLR